MQCECINYITVYKILSPNNQFGCYMCVCTVYWLVTMARYLLTARQAQGRPSPSLEGRSITVTVALFPALFLIYMSALTRYLSISTDRKLQITQVQYFTAENLHRHSTQTVQRIYTGLTLPPTFTHATPNTEIFFFFSALVINFSIVHVSADGSQLP